MNEFAIKLKGLRELRGWSQDELAKRLGVSRSKISNYEQGIREPRFEDLEAIADIFNCTMAYLIEKDRLGPDDMLISQLMGNVETRDRLIDYAKLLQKSIIGETK